MKQEEYGEDQDFKEAIREVGEEKEGQCIWGFVNGVSNSAASARKSAYAISRYAKGEKVWSLVNDQSWALNLYSKMPLHMLFSACLPFGAVLFALCWAHLISWLCGA